MSRSLLALTLGVGLFVALPAWGVESIESFAVAMDVRADATLNVTETITYDFEDSERHGIFRTIPIAYARDGLAYRVRLRVLSVQRDGLSEPYDVQRKGDAVTVKIGSADRTISGSQVYEVRYQVRRAVNVFDGEPEVYWNVTGNDWDVRIAQATFSMIAPGDVGAVRCFVGFQGEALSDCTIATDGRTASAATTRLLDVREGLTVGVRLAPGSVQLPGPWVAAWDVLLDNLGFLLPLPVLMILVLLHRRYGRDPQGRGTIVPEYDPPAGMTPALVGFLIDERVDARDVTASILHLAVRGFLRIEYVDTTFGHTYRFHRLREPEPAMSRFEQGLLNEFFPGGAQTSDLKELKHRFAKELHVLKAQLERDAESQGFVTHQPYKVRGLFYGVGGLVAILGFQFFDSAVSLGVGVFVSGLLIALFGSAMAQRTTKGVLATEHIRGLKQYLTVAEADRLRFHQAPSKRPEQFFKLLPYAVALAVERDWAEQFRDVTLTAPDWYTGRSWDGFNAVVLASSLRDFSSSTRALVASGAGAGGSAFGGGFGGGFSGGGFGGGGGGSW